MEICGAYCKSKRDMQGEVRQANQASFVTVQDAQIVVEGNQAIAKNPP